MRFGLLCGNGPRVDGFANALRSRGHPAPQHMTYEQFIQNQTYFKDLLGTVDVLRIDSPGGGYNIWKYFADYIGMPVASYHKNYGQIYPQTPFVRGTYDSIMSACDLAFKQGVSCTVDPHAVQCFMDKRATHELCKPFIPTPKALPEVNNWTELHGVMKARDLDNVFMKLRFGSAASGVLAIEKLGPKLRVWTSVERVEDGYKTYLFNSLKIRKYLDEKAKRLIDEVAIMGVHVEAWIPKLRLDDKPCDLRLIVVGGVPAHCVVRRSVTPLTNLHLSNERLTAKVVRERIPPKVWDEILDIGVKAGHFFPKHLCIGLDVAIHRHTQKPYLLEVNAFGDHLNDVHYDGLTTYEFQIRYLERKFA